MSFRMSLILMLAVLLACPALGAEQSAGQSDVWRTFAEKLEPGTFVAITLKDGRRVKGHFIQLSGDSLRLKPKTRVAVPARELALADIELVQRQKEGWSAGRKVVTGVGAGVGVLLVVMAIVFAAYGYD
jgi:hypothetical protein